MKNVLVKAKMTYQVNESEDVQVKIIEGRYNIIDACNDAVRNNYYYCRIEDEKKTLFEYTDNRVIEVDTNVKPFLIKIEKEVVEMEKVELKGLEAIKEDIKSLRGSEVKVFGQPQVLASEVNEVTIDILDIIEKLESSEVETIEISKPCKHCNTTGMVTVLCDDEECEEECEECDGMGYVDEEVDALEALEKLYDIGDLKELKCDNSYNWASPVSNNFQFTIYKNTNNDKIYVEFKVHRFGDVRSNYTDVAVLEFSYDSEFLEVISEADKFITVEGLDCDIRVFNDTIEVCDNEGNYLFNTTVYDLEELKKEIKEYKIENNIE